MMSMDEKTIKRGDILYMDLRQRRDVLVQVKDILFVGSLAIDGSTGPCYIVEETIVPFEKHIAYASDLSMSARHLGD